MKPRTRGWALVILRMHDTQKGWRSYKEHLRACHSVYNRRLARMTRFREKTGWRVWSNPDIDPRVTQYTPEQAREINAYESQRKRYTRPIFL